MEKQKITQNKIQGSKRIKIIETFVIFIAATVIILASIILYRHTVNLLTGNLHQRLEAIVRTAAVQFTEDNFGVLRVEKDYLLPEWNETVGKLIAIRENNPDIIFAYILRINSEDASQMEFVADSHSLDPYAKIDLDGNGTIDDADALNWPGQIYEDVPPEAFEGYAEPTTNKELYEDQWGILISGYAPIKGNDGHTKGVMVIDMRANEFLTLTRRTLLPFVIFISVLVVILLALVNILIRIWSKRVQLFAELDRQKDELLGIVSHQLAKPITAIKWNLESFLDGDMGALSKDQKEAAVTMQTMATDLSDLTSMILDVSRVQLGRMSLESQPLNLNDFFKEIFAVIEPTVAEKKIDFVKNISPTELPTVLLDKRYTRMTVENLLTNAVKYTPEKGKVTLDVRIEGGMLKFKVVDTGIGIPKGEQHKIFGKMYRASNAQNSHEGNGFGLYVAKGAVEGQGGKIGFTSTEGKGTTFWFELPIKEA